MEIEMKDFLKYTIKNLWIIIFMILVFALGSFVYCKINNTMLYETDTSLIVITDNSNDRTKNYTVNEAVVKTYVEIIKSRKVLENVINNLKLDFDYNKLYNKVSVSYIEKSGSIKITVKNNTKDNINDITNNIADEFIEETNKLIENNNSKIIVVDESVGYKKYGSISTKKTVFILTLCGLILGCLIVYLKYYFFELV